MAKEYALYVLASKRNGTLYVGSTHHLARRVWEHKNGLAEGFTKEYRVHLLVYYELYKSMYDAMQRERRIKKWRRAWKIKLITENNPEWTDLYDEL